MSIFRHGAVCAERLCVAATPRLGIVYRKFCSADPTQTGIRPTCCCCWGPNNQPSDLTHHTAEKEIIKASWVTLCSVTLQSFNLLCREMFDREAARCVLTEETTDTVSPSVANNHALLHTDYTIRYITWQQRVRRLQVLSGFLPNVDSHLNSFPSMPTISMQRYLLCLAFFGEALKANYVTKPRQAFPNPKAPLHASLFLEDAPLWSFVASHIPRLFARPKKKKEREKMETSRGVDRLSPAWAAEIVTWG